MYSTVLQEIAAFLFGRKYYANIVLTRGTTRTELCSFIFRSKAAALKHRDTLLTLPSFQYVETVSFRSRHEYDEVKIPE